MIVAEAILGNVNTVSLNDRNTDALHLEWFETGKRVLRRSTAGGREIALRFLQESPLLQEGDILWMDEHIAITVTILPSLAIVITPATMADMAAICYEIGNKHLPLFLSGNQVLIPFEEPLFRWLEARGYAPVQEQRVLSNMLRSNVLPHNHNSGSSLFSKIMQLTSK
ncbi:urease accessory protein [Chitinophaga sp. YR573]|uniref:urease accessory protein UreE n=1 Tax=Chitinophaga sp. YR573 TaxID=1881040 RepID=UPI0008B4ACEC|nr:urease accessory protein UreE [Chitinophaga sp. YR573]SEW18411.1 urease accessory protein [Chitinophaga sp. YR573]